MSDDKKTERTVEEIRRDFLKVYHPDKWPHATPQERELLHEICAEQNDYLDRLKKQERVKRTR